MEGCSIDGVAQLSCIVPLIANTIRAVTAIGTVALFIMLLVGGFNFLFSGGDQKKLEMARGTVTQAIIGIIIMALAYVIIHTIEVFTGVNLSQLKFPDSP